MPAANDNPYGERILYVMIMARCLEIGGVARHQALPGHHHRIGRFGRGVSSGIRGRREWRGVNASRVIVTNAVGVVAFCFWRGGGNCNKAREDAAEIGRGK